VPAQEPPEYVIAHAQSGQRWHNHHKRGRNQQNRSFHGARPHSLHPCFLQQNDRRSRHQRRPGKCNDDRSNNHHWHQRQIAQRSRDSPNVIAALVIREPVEFWKGAIDLCCNKSHRGKILHVPLDANRYARIR
jgi:hypothetical protein